MRFGIDVGSELELKLYQAVLLYRNDHGNRVMATVHGLAQADTGGAPALGAGQLLGTAPCESSRSNWARAAKLSTCPRTSSPARRSSSHGGRRQLSDRCSSAKARSWQIFQASSFHIQLCYSPSVTVCYSCARFRRAKGPEPIANWQQRPTGTSTATERCARAPCALPSPFQSLPFPLGSRRSFEANLPIPEEQAA